MPNQFVYGKGVNPGRLRREILDDAGITTQLTVINASSGVLTAVEINFAASLSAAEEAALSGIVSGHIPLPVKEVTPIVNTIKGLSGIVTLTVNEDASITAQQIDDGNATLDITTGIPSASGALIDSGNTQITQMVLGGAGVFGSGVSHTEDDGTFSTSSNNYQQALQLTTPSLETGIYYITWSYEATTEDNDDLRDTVRVRLDDSETLAEHTSAHDDKEPWQMDSGWAIRLLTGGVHTIDIDIRRGSDKSSKIRRRRLLLWRIEL